MHNYSRIATTPEKYFSNVITITSATGVGSSTLLKALKEHFKQNPEMRFASGGSIMRGYADKLGMTIEDLARFNREHPEAGYDERCDAEQRTWGLQNNAVIESRLAHAFVPAGFHVRLDCAVDVRAERRFEDVVALNQNATRADVAHAIITRDADDTARYEALYPGITWASEDFDLNLRSDHDSPKILVEKIIAAHKEWQEKLAVQGKINV